MIYNDAPQQVKNFLTYKSAIQGRSKLTIFQYYHDLRHFFRYVVKSRDPQKYRETEVCDIPFSDVPDDVVLSVSSDEIYNFLLYALEERQNKADSRARKLCAIRALYKYLTNVVYLIKDNPVANIDSPKRSKKLPKFLTLSESNELLNSIDGDNYERDFAIITLFLNCGLRVSELVGINLSDIDGDFVSLNVTGKGSKERKIYLNDSCVSAIKAYLEKRPIDIKANSKNALFISRNRNRISVKTVQWLIYKHLKVAGLDDKHLSVHKLRHTAATLMYQYGKTDVRVLKDILGHEDLSTTQIYTHVSDNQMRKAFLDNPLANNQPKKKIHKSEVESDDSKDDKGGKK